MGSIEQSPSISLGYDFEDSHTRAQLELIDDLRKLGLSNDLDLPQVSCIRLCRHVVLIRFSWLWWEIKALAKALYCKQLLKFHSLSIRTCVPALRQRLFSRGLLPTSQPRSSSKSFPLLTKPRIESIYCPHGVLKDLMATLAWINLRWNSSFARYRA